MTPPSDDPSLAQRCRSQIIRDEFSFETKLFVWPIIFTYISKTKAVPSGVGQTAAEEFCKFVRRQRMDALLHHVVLGTKKKPSVTSQLKGLFP